MLTNNNSGVLLDQLANGELDLCLAYGEVPGGMQKLLIRNVHMPLMISAKLTGDSLQLSRECWVINTAGCPFKSPLEEFWRVQDIQPQSTILAQDLSRKEMVAQGLGIGFLEPQDGLALTKMGLARKHRAHFLQISLWVVFPADFPVKTAIQSFYAILAPGFCRGDDAIDHFSLKLMALRCILLPSHQQSSSALMENVHCSSKSIDHTILSNKNR